jgi:hypothetical protein
MTKEGIFKKLLNPTTVDSLSEEIKILKLAIEKAKLEKELEKAKQ